MKTTFKITMKKILILYLVLVCTISITAQDTITLRNRKVIHAYILDKSKTMLTYKLDTVSAYTTFITKLSNVRVIRYSKLNQTLYDIPKVRKPREAYALGINGGIGMFGSVAYFSAGVDYFVKPYLSAELTVGGVMDPFYTIGGKYWLMDNTNTSGYCPYVGLMYGGFDYGNFLEFPLGVRYLSKSGFQTLLQLSYVQFFDDINKNLKIEFRIGWRFK